MHMFNMILYLSFLATSAIAAAIASDQQESFIRCRAVPRNSGITVRAYTSLDDLIFECQAQNSWLRTSYGCYIPPTNNVGNLIGCQELDSAVPCRIPNKAGYKIIQDYNNSPYTERVDSRVQLWRDMHNKITPCLAQTLANNPKQVVLNENMWSALASWVQSIGCWKASQSEFLQKLGLDNNLTLVDVAEQELPKWTDFHGVLIPELASRRSDELLLFKKPSNQEAYPQCLVFD